MTIREILELIVAVIIGFFVSVARIFIKPKEAKP